MINMLIFSRYNFDHVHRLSLAYYRANTRVQVRLMGLPLVLQAFGHKPKY